jgi:hypothetical protein
MLLAATIALPLPAAETTVRFARDAELGVIRIEARVDGDPVVLIVDTGATRTLIAADVLGIRALPPRVARPAPGVRIAGLPRVTNLGIGDRTLRDWSVLAVDFSAFREVYGADIGGIIGQDALMTFDVVEIDNRRGQIVFRSGGGDG